MKISLEVLLQRLVSKGRDMSRASPVESDARVPPTSIRLKPQTKHFLECQAAALNTSVQSLIALILDGVAESTEDSTAGVLRTIRERFFYLFQVHELDMAGIVSVVKPFGFTLSSLESPTRLADLLDIKALRYLAETFHVRQEWLTGASDYAIPVGGCFQWYKNVHGAAQRLLEYSRTGLRPSVMFIRKSGADFNKARMGNDEYEGREPIGIVIQLTRQTDDGVVFKTYECWQFERWNHWRCRQHMKLLMCFCDEASARSAGISNGGYELDEQDLAGMQAGKPLPAAVIRKFQPIAWYPEDYASLRFEVTEEADDWPEIRKIYEESSLSKLLPV